MPLLRRRNYADEDELVDYEPTSTISSFHSSRTKLSRQYIKQQLIKCKHRIKREYVIPQHIIEYTEKGLIRRPTMIQHETGERVFVPVTMDLIQSIILRQHCRIMKEEELAWFEDGLRWISQQQYQNATKYIPQPHVENDPLREWEDLERSCEAYFGIPLGLCENHWAADYLITQASKGKLFGRVLFQPKFTFSLKRTAKKMCCIPFS